MYFGLNLETLQVVAVHSRHDTAANLTWIAAHNCPYEVGPTDNVWFGKTLSESQLRQLWTFNVGSLQPASLWELRTKFVEWLARQPETECNIYLAAEQAKALHDDAPGRYRYKPVSMAPQRVT